MNCKLCPNNCNVDRDNLVGICKTNNNLKIAKYAPFFYEEPPISGTNGSGAIFFCGCSLLCKFCQNYELSRNMRGKDITNEEFKDIIEKLLSLKVHNINLVNPTHFMHKLKDFFDNNKPKVPIVYNTHGYEKIEMLKSCKSFVDVYLTDLKYYSPNRSLRYCGKDNYFEIASKAILEMVKQKPILIENGIMKSGVIVRHLILPQNTDESLKLIKWYADNIGDNAYLSVMSQYTPFGDTTYPELKRKITHKERDRVYDYMFSLNLKNVFIQDTESADTCYIPEWDY